MKRDPWHYGTWEGARDARRENDLRLTFAEKIRLLEEMEELALVFQRARTRANGPTHQQKSAPSESAVAENQAPYPTATPPGTAPHA